MTAENVTRDDINQVVAAKASASDDLVGKIQLAETGDLASPVNIETALSLLHQKVVNSPTPAQISISDDASAILASQSLFGTNGSLKDAKQVAATDVSAAKVGDIAGLSFVDAIHISDNIAALANFDVASIPSGKSHSIHVDGASVQALKGLTYSPNTYTITDTVKNVLDAKAEKIGESLSFLVPSHLN